jgi:TfoX/Sxy family transcriptional regulator of competence genes
MSYDEPLAARIRQLLAKRDDVVEKRMFGGLCFMVNGAICCGLTQNDFRVRVGPASTKKRWPSRTHARWLLPDAP